MKAIPHFYEKNNIEEALHSKINTYLPTKKISDVNFVISMRNTIANCEAKKENISKAYIIRYLVEYSKTVKKQI